MATDKFIGLQYPLERTPRGLMAQKKGVDQIKADLLQLLLTNPGERVMLPTFGTPLRELFFEPNDPTLELEAKRIIGEAILSWEPRVQIANIQVMSQIDDSDLHPDDTGDESEAILSIKIQFHNPDDINQIEELAMELPIGG